MTTQEHAIDLVIAEKETKREMGISTEKIHRLNGYQFSLKKSVNWHRRQTILILVNINIHTI